jgi:hypothetical protein
VYGQPLTCIGNVSDADKDTITASYTIESKDEDGTIGAFKMETKSVDCPDNQCRIEIAPDNLIPKRRFSCKMTPHDESKEDNDWGAAAYAFAYVPAGAAP